MFLRVEFPCILQRLSLDEHCGLSFIEPNKAAEVFDTEHFTEIGKPCRRLCDYRFQKRYFLLVPCVLVGITAGCDAVSTAGAALTGIICGAAMVFAVSFFDSVAKVDDPVGAISVHGVCGSLGTILTGIFALDGGLLYGGGLHMLGVQLLGAAVYAAWAILCGLILFYVLRRTIGLRVDRRVEEDGFDYYEHGETSYNI